MSESSADADPAQPPSSGRAPAPSLLLDALLDIARSMVVVTDPTGRIIRFNRASEETTGYREQEVVGRHAWEFLLSSRSIQGTREFFQALSRAESPEASETSLLTRDGRKRIIAWNSRLLRDEHGEVQCVVVTGADITREKHLVEDLQRVTTSEEQLQQYYDLLELAQDAIIILSPDRVVYYWNPAAEQLYGWKREEARGKTIHELLRTDFPISTNNLDAALQRHGHWEGELRHTTKDGREVTVASKQVLRRSATGEPLSILEVNNDITALRRAEAEREAILEELTGERSRFEAVLQQLPIGVLVADARTHRVVFANQRIEQLFGMEVQAGMPAATIQQRLRLADGEPLQGDAALLQALRQGEAARDQDLHIARPDGERVRVWASASPVRNRLGEITRFVLTLETVDDSWQRAVAPVISIDEGPVTPEVFVRLFGRKHAALGHPPLEGRLIALLLLSPAPVSLTDASRALGVTKGGLSKVVSEMHARGDLEITRGHSTREHHLALANFVYLRDMVEKRELSVALAALAYALLRDNPDLDPEVHWRVRDLADVRAQHALNISRLLEVRHKAQERARDAHLRDNWDAVPPKQPE